MDFANLSSFKIIMSFYLLFRLNTNEYDLTWMYTEGREMAVFTDQQFEFALMKMRGMVDYEFLVKLRPLHQRTENQEATTL